MPDNVSLTAQEINTLKSVQTNAQTRLNLKNFCFNSAANAKLNARTFPFIGNNSNGMRVYAGIQDITLSKGDATAKTVQFDMTTISFTNQPALTATFSSSDLAILNNDITVTITTDSANINIVKVNVKAGAGAKSEINGSVHLMAIGYA